MRYLRAALLVCALLFGLAQLYQPLDARPQATRSNPAWEQPGLDPRVANVLKRSCADCHSYETHWPWYARISPLSWWLAQHVEEARRHLNLSDPDALSDTARDEISNEIEFGTMPLKSYLLLHSEARVTEEEKKIINAWASGQSSHAGASQ